MGYLEINVYENEQDAQVKAAALQQAGRRIIEVVKCDSSILFECPGNPANPCVRKYDKDGNPKLYVVLSEG
jgi:hypothetical protein